MRTFTIIFLFVFSLPVLVRGSEDSEYVTLPVNVSFFPGFSIGESVAEGKKIKNHVSLNILAGSAAKLEGVEWGGIWNSYSEDILGVQWAGIANTVEGSGKGAQWAGIINMNGNDFLGAQWAGIVNKAGGSFVGAQWAGIINSGGGNFLGAQWAGIVNKADGNFEGAQWAGIVNINGNDFRGAQWAGIANKADGDFVGAQWAGIVNRVGNLKAGIQFAGIANVAEEVERGLQVGLVNVSQENEGIPVGPLSYVREVGLRFDAWADEAKFLNAGLRTGTERFHNILFVGAQVNDPFRWSLGWVFSGHIDLGESQYLDIDVSTQHINEDEVWTDKMNILNKFRILGGLQINDSISLYAGPTLNYFVSEVHDGSDLVSWSMSEKKSGDRWKRWWPGFVVGVKYYK